MTVGLNALTNLLFSLQGKYFYSLASDQSIFLINSSSPNWRPRSCISFIWTIEDQQINKKRRWWVLNFCWCSTYWWNQILQSPFLLYLFDAPGKFGCSHSRWTCRQPRQHFRRRCLRREWNHQVRVLIFLFFAFRRKLLTLFQFHEHKSLLCSPTGKLARIWRHQPPPRLWKRVVDSSFPVALTPTLTCSCPSWARRPSMISTPERRLLSLEEPPWSVRSISDIPSFPIKCDLAFRHFPSNVMSSPWIEKIGLNLLLPLMFESVHLVNTSYLLQSTSLCRRSARAWSRLTRSGVSGPMPRFAATTDFTLPSLGGANRYHSFFYSPK